MQVVLCALHPPGEPPPRYQAPPPADEGKLKAAQAAAKEAGIPSPKPKPGNSLSHCNAVTLVTGESLLLGFRGCGAVLLPSPSLVTHCHPVTR
jgi:hypothetical protein